MNILRLPLAAAALAVTALLVSCGGGGGGDAGSGGGIGGTGGMRVSITDAPACGYDEVNITVDRIRVHQDAGVADGAAGWQEIVLNPPRRIDLLDLTNGVLDELGQVSLPAGRYTQLRLVLADNGGSTPFANSVIPTGGAEVALTTPSAQQSGLKLKTAIDVPEGQVADVLLDFDACKSVVKRGNSGQYNLKPVISVTTLLADAGLRVTGTIAPAIAAGATVSVQRDGVPVKATVPNPITGQFVLTPVPAGTYDVVVTSTTQRTAVVTGVPVVSGTPTVLNAPTTPLLPPAATFRTVSGTVTPATATVRMLQILTGGPTIEVAWAPVDALSGDFSAGLPIEAPVRAAYGPTLAFGPDNAAASRYTVQSTSGATTKNFDFNTFGAVPPLAITFP